MSQLPKFNNAGERWDLELRQGSTFGPVRHTLFNPDAITPVDLTGCQIRGQVRKKALAPVVVALFDAAIAPVATDGYYEFGLTDEATAAIPCGDTLAAAESLYEYDVELEDSLGRVVCTLWGNLRIKAEVTKP